MGLFDFLKKKKTNNESTEKQIPEEKSPKKCSECMCTIKGRPWKLGEKYYCKACYNRRMANGLRGFTYQRLDFEMPIDNVFLIKNHGVAVTGTIRKGCVYRGDTVIVNDREYTVRQIDVIPNEVDSAKEGMNVALHLSTMDAGLFKRGDLITVKPLQENQKSTFTCDVCGKERPVKYRHKGNTCSDCAEKGTARKTDVCSKSQVGGNQSSHNIQTDEPQSISKKLSDISFADYAVKLKRYAVQFIPGNINEIGTQRQMLKMIEPVIPVTEFLMGVEIQHIFETNSLGKLTVRQLQGMVAANTDRWLSAFNENKLYQNIKEKDTDVLINAWVVLAFYCDILRPEYQVNLKKYYNLVISEIYKRGFVVPEPECIVPIAYENNNIMISSEKFIAWKKQNPLAPQFELCGVLPLTEKEPRICLYEDGVKTKEYVLQTEGNEDFTGKYFMISVRIGMLGNSDVPALQMDGFISDTPEDRQMTMNDVGYRMEGHFLACGGENSKKRYEMNRGQDLIMKALKYQGYTTPANIRLVGICPDCGKSFCFHGYAFYMMQNDVAYSDDGLDCCEISTYDLDKDNWSYEVNGKTFRYYNSFNCPHCGTPYIDYRKYPENKVFGVSGCVLLDRKYYQCK